MRSCCVFLFILWFQHTVAQHSSSDSIRGGNALRFTFYNVQNLFDTHNDKGVHDGEFTAEGSRRWNHFKYRKKQQLLYKTLVGVGGWEPPAIIGLAEIENRGVLEYLVDSTPLKQYYYEIVHQESPDKRGIDVALLYRPDKVRLLNKAFIPVQLPQRTTRDICYAAVEIFTADTLHIFINHWPSRYGGQMASEPSRILAAQTLKSNIQNLIDTIPNAQILVAGDLNDHPTNKSVAEVLCGDSGLINLMSIFPTLGTYKYQGEWQVLDHLLVSPNILNQNQGLTIPQTPPLVYRAEYLLMDEENRVGKRPFPTYLGYTYLGGFSDHLPIYLDFYPSAD